MKTIIQVISTILTIIGTITAIRITVWAIFSGYFLAKEKKGFWRCWGWIFYKD